MPEMLRANESASKNSATLICFDTMIEISYCVEFNLTLNGKCIIILNLSRDLTFIYNLKTKIK